MLGIGALCTGRIIPDMTVAIVLISVPIWGHRVIMAIIIIITIPIMIIHITHYFAMIIIIHPMQVIQVIIMVLIQTFPIIDFDQTQEPELLEILTL